MSQLKDIVAAHSQTLRAENSARIDGARKDAATAVAQVNVSLLSSANNGVAQVHANQALLEEAAQRLRTETERFAKQTQQWLAMHRELNASLDGLGDVQAFGLQIEADMRTIASGLKYVTNAERSR